MKTKSKSLTILLVFGLIFPLILNYNFNFNNEFKAIQFKGENGINGLKTSGVYTGIVIDDLLTSNTTTAGNWTWAVNQPWCKGSGTILDPYIIEDHTWNMSLSIDGLKINNSHDKYFTVKNCTFKWNEVTNGMPMTGIFLLNTTHGLITGNLIYHLGYGIALEDCENINLTGNILYDHIDGISLVNSNLNNIIGNTACNNTGTGIYLSTSPNGNTIFNNTANGNHYGIYFDYVNNSRLIDNNCSNNVQGLYFHVECNNNTVSGNIADDNSGDGITIYDSCDFNNITGNTANGNQWGMYFDDECHNNTISGNTVNNNTDWGIFFTGDCHNNTISGNTANDNNYAGIQFDQECHNNTISGNTVNNNTDWGIFLWKSRNNTISGNTANGNDYGIYLDGECHNNTISGNTANNNTQYGIYLDSSDYNNITGNAVNNNTQHGIYLHDSDNNVISGNTANDNLENGIRLYTFCYNNTISGNTIDGNAKGIYMDQCFNNTILDNTISDNDEHGIYIDEDSYYQEITENIIYNNTIGIYIIGSSHNNLVYKNFFLKNGKHAIDDDPDNKWNSTTIGNYWDNHTGPDVNDDGIVDTPYNISGTPGGIDYLPIAEDGAPSIIINSPDPGDIFDATAPSFNVRITDDYLDEMWYSIDGGLANYTFTANGTIDQTAWEMATKGDVTITFYASDIPGNIGTAEVIIVKDYEAPTININSPTAGVFFASIAPTFNVKITDDYLDIMWYTLDGGLNNYTFTTNGTIDQSAWNAVADGAVILKFYANDTLCNVGSAEVSIIKDATSPIIIINSPVEGDRFGRDAPLFNTTITEDNLDSIWYSFDGGVTTYAITDGTIFNQTAWAALSQGEVTITFYARDLAGNEASESVTVIKSIPAGGLNTGVIITIVVVSVVGGVAVITGIYIFMKRRVTPT